MKKMFRLIFTPPSIEIINFLRELAEAAEIPEYVDSDQVEFNPDSIEYKYKKALAKIELLEKPKTQVETVVSEIKQQYKTPAQAFDAKRLKDLEKENSKLKQANSALKECNDDLVSRIKKCGEGLD